MKKILLMFLMGMLLPLITIAGDYDHSIDAGKLVFEWKVQGENLNIYLKGKTKGWVAVGFNATSAMKGANILIGSVKGSKVSVRDDYGTSRTGHKSDTKLKGKKNVSNISGSEKGGVTEIRFSIPLNSGDKKDPAINPNQETVVILAMGRSDSFRTGHALAKTYLVNLSNGMFKEK